jgi:hypothetical protein
VTTDDPAVVWGVILATSGAYFLAALLIKAALDQDGAPETTHQADAPPKTPPTPALRPHAHPAALDETAPLTTVQPTRARHRKGSPTCN